MNEVLVIATKYQGQLSLKVSERKLNRLSMEGQRYAHP